MNVSKMTPVVDVYTMANDKNFAPYHNGKMMSLACCMVRIRNRVGKLWFANNGKIVYWIMGRVGLSLYKSKRNYLIYFMKVTDVMNFNQYYHEHSYRPDALYKYNHSCKCGIDNCDCRLNASYYTPVREVKFHNAKHDIGKGHYVLTSNEYCYYDWINDNSNKLCLDEWGINELEWKGNSRSNFRRKFNFNDTVSIIRKLEELKNSYCMKYYHNNVNIRHECIPEQRKSDKL